MGRSIDEMLSQLPPRSNDSVAPVNVLNPAEEARLRNADPDQAAQAQQLAGTSSLPSSVIERNLDAVKKRDEVEKFNRFAASVPEVRHLGSEWNVVAKDDVDTLDRLRIAGKNLGAGVLQIGGGVAGIMQAVEEGMHVADNVVRGASDALLGTTFGGEDNTRFQQTADVFASLRKKAQNEADKLTAENDKVGVFEQGVYSGLQSLATNLPILAGAVVAKSPSLALEGMSGLVYGSSYSQAREQGLTIAQAQLYGGTQAAVEYATEKIPMHLLFGDVAKKTGLFKTLLHQAASEVPGEQIATFLQDFTDFAMLPENKDKTVSDFLAARPDAAYQTLVATLVATGVQGALVHQIGTRMSGDAAQATDREKFLKEIGSLAEASKLRERSPEQFRRYMEAVAPETDIFFDSEDAQSLMQGFEPGELPEDLEARIAESAENDIPMRISAAEYATYFADSHTAQNLAARARVGQATAMNAEEAKNIESEFAARAEQAIAESNNAEATRVEGRKINEQVLAQIASTGRFRPDVANAYASLVENFFVTMSQRTGQTPSELFAQYPLRVQAVESQKPAKLDQLPAEAFTTQPAQSYNGEVGHEIIVRNNGKRVGSMDLEEAGANLQIKLVNVDASLRGQGVGQQLIQKAYDEAQRQGRNLVSDRAVSAKQLRAYEGLRRKGWVIEYADPEQVRKVLELADQFERQGEDLSALGASAPLGGAVVTRIAPPAQGVLNQAALKPVASLADQAGPTPQGFTRFTHFGNHVVPQLDPAFMGTGMKGAEGARGGPRVTSLYPEKGFQKESGVGNVQYAVDVPTSQLYDATADPLGLAKDAQQPVSFTLDDNGNFVPAETRFDMNTFEQSVKDAGFAGYTTPGAEGNMKGQARLFHPVPVRNAQQSEVEKVVELFQLKPENEPQGFGAVAPYLTDEERNRLMKNSARKLVDVFKSLPRDQDFADAALAGAAKRGWYATAVRTLRQVFGDADAPRFAALLAATSPQVSVQTNLQNAVAIWARWNEAGRPAESLAINNIINSALGGEKSVLGAWRNNSVRALSAEDAYGVTLSGPKVNSFMRNLMGDVQEVTNDTWMANFAAVNQILFKGDVRDPSKSGPGKRPGYVAFAAKIRRVAEKLTQQTGEQWTPAEVQETVWSWAKTAYELADVAGETRSVEDLVRAGEITDARVAGADDFASMLKNNVSIREILEKAGYGDAINAIEAEFGREQSGGDSARQAVTPALLRSARRLDEVRRQRQADAAAGTERGRTQQQAAEGTSPSPEQPLSNLPESSPGPVPAIKEAAQRYVEDVLVNKPPFPPQTRYVPVNVARATTIAAAYEAAQHNPHDFNVAVSYDALIDETLAQFQVVKQLGLNIEFIEPGQADPYPEGPRQVLDDLRNGHLWVFPTDQGFGQTEAPDNPLLRPTQEKIGDRTLLANDVFRIVHDVFGHGKEGVGFGPTGEENAWHSHVRMYSPLAARAMTSETRGQNSWVNYGPHGEANRSNQKQTVYAEQKATLLPDEIAFAGIDEASTAPLNQGEAPRGSITLGTDITANLQEGSVVSLFEGADLSTFLHESGHFFFEVMADLAARPNAPAAIQQDMQTLLKWVGFKGTLQEWRATPIPQRRDAHEQFARGFEAWLMEGNAPNEEMRGLFHRFRAWLVNVYKKVERLNVTLTDEVRTVMQGMVATADQIKQAEAARSYMPLFESQAASGMTPEEWQAYQDTTRAATEHAQDALQARSMRNLRWLDNARTKELKKLQAENAAKRQAVREEVAAQVDNEPARVAETLIGTGLAYTENLVDGSLEEVKLENSKLNVQALQDAYGTREEYRQMLKDSGVENVDGVKAPWEALPRELLTKGPGMTADQIAELTGFSSGDELISALVALPNREVTIEQLTDRVMMERYGDLNNPQTLACAVDQAVHNQHRTRVVASELQALDDSLKTQPGGIATVRRAARDFAQKVVNRQKIRDLRPNQYLAAETKAARDSRAALAKGDLKLAATRKRDQLFNGYASRDANRALDVVDKGLRYLRRFGDSKVRAGIESSYRDQIDKLLERYDLRKRTLREIDKRTALASWIKEQQESGNEPIIPEELVDESRQTNYQNLPVEAFAGLVDAVKNIEHLANVKKKLLAAKEQRDFDTAVTEIADSIEANAPKGQSKTQLEKDLSLWGRFSDTLHSWLTHLRKFSSVARQIDGGQDGGKFWSYMVRPLNDAADKEVRMRAEATQQLNKLLDTLPALRTNFAQKLGQKVKGPPKLFIPQIGKSLTLEARLAVALNWGNDGNRERIMEGNKWTEAQAQAVIDTLTKEEMDFVQQAWDYIGSYWNEIAAKEERVTGVRPNRVEPTPVTTKHGTYEGGYYPIVADPMRSEKAAQQGDAELIAQSLRGAVTRATTRRGHTKARVGGKDPVRLDLGVLTQHVGQVIHDLSWHETLIDAGRLLRDKRISESLRDKYGSEITRLMRKTLDDVARGEVMAQDAGERVANYFRVGTTIAGMGFSVTTAMMQPLGLTQSFVRVGYRYMAGGLTEFMARPAQSIKTVREKSTFMRDRGLILNRELGEITNRLGAQKSNLTTIYFAPIQALQTAVDVPTWLGAYNKAIDAGETDERAVALADQAVRDSQSSGQMQDLAEAQRGGAWKKLWTNFYSYFSATYQLSAESVQQFKRKPSLGQGIKTASDFFMLYTVPTVLTLLIREGLRGDLDKKDPDQIAEALLRAQLSNFLGVFPYVRELGGIIEGFDYRGPAGASIIGQLGDVATQVGQGEVDESLLRSINRAAGTAFHYPAAQVDRTVRGMIAISEGKAGPQALLVGPPKKEK